MEDEKDITLSTTDANSNISPVRFRTEATPSREITNYLGFSYPAPDMQASYPDALAPLLTLKYQGIIQKIYRKHYGGGALRPLLVDVDGNEIEPELQGSLTINSVGSDEALADLLSHCLPRAQDCVKLHIFVWERS